MAKKTKKNNSILALSGRLTWALRLLDVAAAATLFSAFDPSVYIALWSG